MKNEPGLTDNFDRRIDYLRISLTDRCNLRCRYCLPKEGVKQVAHDKVLRYEEIVELAGLFYRQGVRKWRLTGGEPLIKPNLAFLIKQLKALGDDVRLALTTNALLLEPLLDDLVGSGISRINISLDTLKPDRYRYLSRGGDFNSVWRGVTSALGQKIEPVRLNVIIFKNYNEDEILDFARLAVEYPLWVRFIEYMPLGDQDFYARFGGVSGHDVKKIIKSELKLSPALVQENAPAVYYRPDSSAGLIGFINPLSHAFCQTCNRLRLSSVGRLRPCLFSDREFDLKTPLRIKNMAEVENLIDKAVKSKPAGYSISKSRQHTMSAIGG